MKIIVVAISCLAILLLPVLIQAHCEIPCGIYNDEMRFDMIKEHITTLEKSMRMITELSSAKTIDYNQLVRWIDNKEQHANEIQDIISQYFLTQRVKPGNSEYINQLKLCYSMLVLAMQAKQTTDREIISKLNKTLEKFRIVYFGPDHEKHTH